MNGCVGKFKDETETCLQAGPPMETDGLFDNSGNNEGKYGCIV